MQKHAPHLVIHPGWQDSGPAHWQSHWQIQLAASTGSSRVAQQDWQHPDVAAWVAALHAHLLALDGPLMFAAHSLGCITLARWAQRYPQHAARIGAALLVAPADVERADAPHEIAGFAPIPLNALPFPAAVVASDDDPYCSLARSRYFAEQWQVPFHILHGAGHINAESGLGNWPLGLQMLEDLLGNAAQRRSSFQEKCR